MQLIYISQVGVEIVRGALALFVQHEFGIRAVFIVCADKQKRHIRNDSEISVAKVSESRYHNNSGVLGDAI